MRFDKDYPIETNNGYNGAGKKGLIRAAALWF
jgi:hypothetical protein